MKAYIWIADMARDLTATRESRPMLSRTNAAAAVAVALFATSLVGAEISGDERHVTVRLSAGTESNPLRVQGDGPGAAFGEIALDAAAEGIWAPAVGWFVDADAVSRSHAGELSDADSTRAAARLGLELTPRPAAARRFMLAVGADFDRRRSTLTDRVDGRIYEVARVPATDPPTTVELGDRYDSNSGGLFLDARFSVRPRLRLSFQTRVDKVDYTREYLDDAGLESLDYRSWSVEPGLLVALTAQAALKVSWVRSGLDYDEQPALDSSGAALSGETRRFDQSDLRMSLVWNPASRWSVQAGARGGGRDDLAAGYYDFDSWVGYASVERRPDWRRRYRLLASVSRLDYDRAVVADSTTEETRGSRVQLVSAYYEFDLRERIGLRFEAGAQRTDSRDAEFTHDREWATIGVEFRL